MKTVPLYGGKARGRVALVDDEDYNRVRQYRWNIYEQLKPGRRPSGPYAIATIRRNGKKTTIRMHALLTGWPSTDHKDHNGLNNQRSNLRECTTRQNLHNRRPNLGAVSRYKGVCWLKDKRRWRAMIWLPDRRVFIGLFTDEIQAALAYDAVARAEFGEYACLNFTNAPPREILPALWPQRGRPQYWADAWELRHLDWLRFHGFWPQAGRMPS